MAAPAWAPVLLGLGGCLLLSAYTGMLAFLLYKYFTRGRSVTRC
jgi:hypothetical protein